MSQKRTHSFIESATNTIVGYAVNFVANMLILPLFGFHVTIEQNIQISILYVLISIIRGYCIRRLFNINVG
ncbi:MAG: DUF7220 family protein [Akkermansiaceae bacterium]